MRPPLIAGNWKMHGLASDLPQAQAIAAGARAYRGRVDVMLCPPSTLIERLARIAEGTPLIVGAQDSHMSPNGAHTGDVSAEMLADAGARAVILGHSERRSEHREADETVRAKAETARRAGLAPIVCLGETEEQRDAGEAIEVVSRQLEGSLPDGDAGDLVIAYEPIWAIGTGRIPSEADIADMHAHIRSILTARFGRDGAEVRILYGGSMKPSNAAGILRIPDVNGGLVGGASLKADDFLPIIESAAR